MKRAIFVDVKGAVANFNSSDTVLNGAAAPIHSAWLVWDSRCIHQGYTHTYASSSRKAGEISETGAGKKGVKCRFEPSIHLPILFSSQTGNHMNGEQTDETWVDYLSQQGFAVVCRVVGEDESNFAENEGMETHCERKQVEHACKL
jgi:hypothetical protein